MNRKIEAIIFDWGDTLSPASPERYFPVKRIKRKFKLSDEVIGQCLTMLERTKTPFTPRTIEEEKAVLADFWSLVAKEIKIKNPDSFVSYLLRWALEDYVPPLFPEVLKTIRYLSQQKYHFAVLSNGWPKRSLEIKRSKIGKYFKTILVSSIIGAEKPEIKAYQIAIGKIGVSANQILMIDNKDTYLVPAHNLGMKVLYCDRIDFNPNSQFPRIKEISEVIGYLKNEENVGSNK
jgi:HAD superfamily hydrolase (TIGR01509 family)